MNEPTLNELLEQYRDMKTELAPAIARLSELEKEIKAHVRETGETATIEGASVKIRKGSTRTSWDSKGLNGYAVAYPEIEEFKTVKQSADVVTIKVD